jgi:hypothetical protein
MPRTIAVPSGSVDGPTLEVGVTDTAVAALVGSVGGRQFNGGRQAE